MQHRDIKPVNFDSYLPSEIWLQIFLYLNPENLLLIALVNTAFRNFSRNNFIWEKKSFTHFFSLYNRDRNKPNINWYNSFKNYYKDDYKSTDISPVSFAFKKQFFPDDIEIHIKRIFSLVKEGDLGGLTTYKIRPRHLDIKDNNGITLLEWADKCKHQFILNHFYTIIKDYYFELANRFIPANTDDQNRTLLHWSTLCNQPNEVVLLLISDDDVRSAMKGGIQTIHLACAKGRIEIVKLLLDRYSDLLNQTDDLGQTPIFYAVNSGCSETIKLLLSMNAQLDIVNRNDQVIHMACRDGFFKSVQLLLGKQPNLLNQTDSRGQTPILWAASRGHADIVEFLAEQGADLNQVTNAPHDSNHHGYTALHWAVEGNYLATVESLINHNARLDILIRNDQVIHMACRDGFFKSVQLLLGKQPNLLNQTDSRGQTPILWAASRGHADIVEFLAEQGADLNQVTNAPHDPHHNGYTALHWAAEGSYLATVKVLLNNNASSFLVCSRNKTPDKVCDDNFIKNLIYLDIFIHRLEKNTSAHKEKDIFSLFRKDQADISAVLDAANVLKAVMLGNAKYSMLERYRNELITGQLGSIYNKVFKYLITDSSASLLSNIKIPEISKMSLQ